MDIDCVPSAAGGAQISRSVEDRESNVALAFPIVTRRCTSALRRVLTRRTESSGRQQGAIGTTEIERKDFVEASSLGFLHHLPNRMMKGAQRDANRWVRSSRVGISKGNRRLNRLESDLAIAIDVKPACSATHRTAESHPAGRIEKERHPLSHPVSFPGYPQSLPLTNRESLPRPGTAQRLLNLEGDFHAADLIRITSTDRADCNDSAGEDYASLACESLQFRRPGKVRRACLFVRPRRPRRT